MSRSRILRWIFAALVTVVALPAGASPAVFVPAVIQRNYETARAGHEANPEDDQAACQYAHALFDRAEYSRDSTERANFANEGIALCKKVVAHQPRLAAGHYYLAMNMAQLARTKLLGALPLLSRMETGWNTARALNEMMDYAGPDRYVGLLYRDAPGWPVSLGDAHKARRHLLRAVVLSPNFPENYLNLIESYEGWNEHAPAMAALDKLRDLLPAARKEFTGEYWDESWKDWNQRLEKISTKLETRAAGAGQK